MKKMGQALVRAGAPPLGDTEKWAEAQRLEFLERHCPWSRDELIAAWALWHSWPEPKPRLSWFLERAVVVNSQPHYIVQAFAVARARRRRDLLYR